MYHSKLKTGNTLAVFFLLFFSLIFRFVFSATHISFGQDIARDAWLIEQRINQKNLIVDYGPKASVGNFYLPPLYYQLHVLFSLVTNNNPLTMKWVITFVEALSPVLLFLIRFLLPPLPYPRTWQQNQGTDLSCLRPARL